MPLSSSQMQRDSPLLARRLSAPSAKVRFRGCSASDCASAQERHAFGAHSQAYGGDGTFYRQAHGFAADESADLSGNPHAMKTKLRGATPSKCCTSTAIFPKGQISSVTQRLGPMHPKESADLGAPMQRSARQWESIAACIQ